MSELAPRREIPSAVPRFALRFLQGKIGQFFLGLSLILISGYIAGMTESHKFLKNRTAVLATLTERSEAELSDVLFVVNENQTSWADGSTENRIPYPGLSTLRELTLTTPDHQKLKRYFPGFMKIDLDQSALRLFLDESGFRHHVHSTHEHRDELKNTAFYAPSRIQLLIEPAVKTRIQGLEDRFHTWELKTDKPINRWEGILLSLDQPLLNEAFRWYHESKNRVLIPVNHHPKEAALFVPSWLHDEQVNTPILEQLMNFNPYAIWGLIFSLFVFAFFYPLSRAVAPSALNHPLFILAFLGSIPFWSGHYATFQKWAFGIENTRIRHEIENEWSAERSEAFSMGLTGAQLNSTFERHSLDPQTSFWKPLLSRFEIARRNRIFRTPNEALKAIYSDLEHQIEQMSPAEKLKFHDELSAIRDGRRRSLSFLEPVYQMTW